MDYYINFITQLCILGVVLCKQRLTTKVMNPSLW